MFQPSNLPTRPPPLAQQYAPYGQPYPSQDPSQYQRHQHPQQHQQQQQQQQFQPSYSPPRYFQRSQYHVPKSISMSRENLQACYNCGTPGHFAQDCPEPRRVLPAGARRPSKRQRTESYSSPNNYGPQQYGQPYGQPGDDYSPEHQQFYPPDQAYPLQQAQYAPFQPQQAPYTRRRGSYHSQQQSSYGPHQQPWGEWQQPPELQYQQGQPQYQPCDPSSQPLGGPYQMQPPESQFPPQNGYYYPPQQPGYSNDYDRISESSPSTPLVNQAPLPYNSPRSQISTRDYPRSRATSDTQSQRLDPDDQFEDDLDEMSLLNFPDFRTCDKISIRQAAERVARPFSPNFRMKDLGHLPDDEEFITFRSKYLPSGDVSKLSEDVRETKDWDEFMDDPVFREINDSDLTSFEELVARRRREEPAISEKDEGELSELEDGEYREGQDDESYPAKMDESEDSDDYEPPPAKKPESMPQSPARNEFLPGLFIKENAAVKATVDAETEAKLAALGVTGEAKPIRPRSRKFLRRRAVSPNGHGAKFRARCTSPAASRSSSGNGVHTPNFADTVQHGRYSYREQSYSGTSNAPQSAPQGSSKDAISPSSGYEKSNSNHHHFAPPPPPPPPPPQRNGFNDDTNDEAPIYNGKNSPSGEFSEMYLNGEHSFGDIDEVDSAPAESYQMSTSRKRRYQHDSDSDSEEARHKSTDDKKGENLVSRSSAYSRRW